MISAFRLAENAKPLYELVQSKLESLSKLFDDELFGTYVNQHWREFLLENSHPLLPALVSRRRERRPMANHHVRLGWVVYRNFLRIIAENAKQELIKSIKTPKSQKQIYLYTTMAFTTDFLYLVELSFT